MSGGSPYPPIADYGFISDCHSSALVSRSGSIDWLCMPRFDSGTLAGRILDWKRGGYCAVGPARGRARRTRRYLPETLVLETTFEQGGDEVRLIDCFAIRRGGAANPYRQLLRVVEGVRGRMDLRLEFCPRYDYGEVRPWMRREGPKRFSAIGGDDALVVWCDADLAMANDHDLRCEFTVRPGERVRCSIQYLRPETVDDGLPDPPSPQQLDQRLDYTISWWRRWTAKADLTDESPDLARSAIVLKGLTNAPTGSVAAAATTSLPEVVGGSRNWDYRYSWVRDSAFTVRTLAELGWDAEADGLRRFIERSAAGHADDLQVMYGLGGERRLGEQQLDLEGYRESRPVRVGNTAASQLQLDTFGHVVRLAWLWHRRGHSPDDDYWRFIVALGDAVTKLWDQPDSGIWEIRDRPEHFVYSKVMCWVALERGLDLARECARKAPERRWRSARDRIRTAVETKGYERRRGVFIRSFGSKALDASLLRLPDVGFVDYRDDRMIRTVDAIREELGTRNGLIRRFLDPVDREQRREGAFLACSFWLAEALARQDRIEEAQEVFDATVAAGNDLGLFSEQADPESGEMLGNLPQGLTHLSHIAAAIALADR